MNCCISIPRACLKVLKIGAPTLPLPQARTGLYGARTMIARKGISNTVCARVIHRVGLLPVVIFTYAGMLATGDGDELGRSGGWAFLRGKHI